MRCEKHKKGKKCPLQPFFTSNSPSLPNLPALSPATSLDNAQAKSPGQTSHAKQFLLSVKKIPIQPRFPTKAAISSAKTCKETERKERRDTRESPDTHLPATEQHERTYRQRALSVRKKPGGFYDSTTDITRTSHMYMLRELGINIRGKPKVSSGEAQL